MKNFLGLDYGGMIHLAYLVAKRGDYSHFDFERRKSIFWAIFYFSSKVKVKIRTVVIDKKYINMDLTQYNDISMEFVILNDSEYLLLKNDSKNVFTDISSMTDVFDEKHDQALKQLPLHSYSHYGWSSTFKLFKP